MPPLPYLLARKNALGTVDEEVIMTLPTRIGALVSLGTLFQQAYRDCMKTRGF
jgi:hypothetical protein